MPTDATVLILGETGTDAGPHEYPPGEFDVASPVEFTPTQIGEFTFTCGIKHEARKARG